MSGKMTKKQRKAEIKGYREAGQIYWTKDMEKQIRKIRADKYAWMSAAIAEGILLAGLIVKLIYG